MAALNRFILFKKYTTNHKKGKGFILGPENDSQHSEGKNGGAEEASLAATSTALTQPPHKQPPGMDHTG
jgi:hypothetical protein